MEKTTMINNGQSANNVELKDMTPQIDGLTQEQFIKFAQKYNDLVNSNEMTLSARVIAKDVIKGKEIVDKKTGIPVTDEFGQTRHYSDRFSITLVFQGGSLDYACTSDMYMALDLNSTYKFSGYLGFVKEFGKDVVSPIFQSWSKVF